MSRAVKPDSRLDNIQRLLASLHKHSDILSEAFSGPIAGDDKSRGAAIGVLVAAGALRPYEEGTYYLTTALNDYFAGVLSSYHAMQALTRISQHVWQADKQWAELLQLRRGGAARDAARIHVALERSIIDIGDIMERNIALLNSMVLGRYGDVEDLKSKFRQNRYYGGEVKRSLADLSQVEVLANRIIDGALVEGLPRMRQLAARRLSANLLGWTARLKDAQAVISRRLFDAHKMERRLRQLARYASWLQSNPTLNGWDLDVDAGVPQELAHPTPLPVRLQPHFDDPTTQNMTRLIEAVRRLPQPLDARPKPAPREEDNSVLASTMEVVEPSLQPHELALRRLFEHLYELGTSGVPDTISLTDWKARSEPDIDGLATMELEHWLLYAAVQMSATDYRPRFVFHADLAAFAPNRQFYDVEVFSGAQDADSQRHRDALIDDVLA